MRDHIPTIAAYSLTGCAGELLVILENLDKLLPFARVTQFPFAQSKNEIGKVDIALVEGSVSQPHDLEKLKSIRENAHWLVAVGNCAIWGCVQKNSHVCAAMGATPLDTHVRVDAKLPGCPINANQFLAVMASLLRDQLPYVTHKPVCLECKLNENPCVLIEKGLPCLGPITAAGCGALCPSFGAACYGCWGPCEDPQMEAMTTILSERGYSLPEIVGRISAFGIPEQLLSRVEAMRDRVASESQSAKGKGSV